jgi:anti-anti-sigma factor
VDAVETDSRELANGSLSTQTQAAVLRLAETEYGSHDDTKLARVRQLLLDHAAKLDPPHLVVDLSAVHHFGARFVAILVSTWKQVRERNRQLALCGPTPFCAELIQILGLHKLFAIYPTQRIALEEIARHIRSEEEESLVMRDKLRMDLPTSASRQPHQWYDGRPTRCSRPSRACCGK